MIGIDARDARCVRDEQLPRNIDENSRGRHHHKHIFSVFEHIGGRQCFFEHSWFWLTLYHHSTIFQIMPNIFFSIKELASFWMKFLSRQWWWWWINEQVNQPHTHTHIYLTVYVRLRSAKDHKHLHKFQRFSLHHHKRYRRQSDEKETKTNKGNSTMHDVTLHDYNIVLHQLSITERKRASTYLEDDAPQYFKLHF